MKLAIIGMGIMGCNYAKMISKGLTQGIEITAVTRITEERKEALREIFDKGAEGSKSLLLANAMYLSSWKKQMVEIPQTIEEELAFEAEYEEAYKVKKLEI